MEIREAIEHISKSDSFIALGSKQALTNDDDLILFVNQITEQINLSNSIKEKLVQLFGAEAIQAILDFSSRKSVEQDFIVINKCIEADLKAEEELANKKILLELLLTDDILRAKPSTTEIVSDYGRLMAIFGNNINNTRTGKHCVVKDTEQNLINWLKPFDEVILGCGIPMLQSFTITKIKEHLK